MLVGSGPIGDWPQTSHATPAACTDWVCTPGQGLFWHLLYSVEPSQQSHGVEAHPHFHQVLGSPLLVYLPPLQDTPITQWLFIEPVCLGFSIHFRKGERQEKAAWETSRGWLGRWRQQSRKPLPSSPTRLLVPPGRHPSGPRGDTPIQPPPPPAGLLSL